MTITRPGHKARAAGRPRFGLAWVTWRQQRATLLTLAGLAGALGAVMLAAGLRGHAIYPAFVENRCLQAAGPGVTQVSSAPICRQLGSEFPGIGGPFYLLSGHSAVVVDGSFLDSYPADVTLALLALFLLTGMFLGAPVLGRELGQGTFRFAWTQGTSPVRWCVTKLLLLGGAALGAGAGLGALGAWSLQPFNLAGGGSSRWQDGQFETTVLTAAAWAGLAFALGAFGGTLLRRTVPAMAATAAGVGALLVATFWKLNALLLGVHPLITQDNSQASAAGLGTTAPPVWLLDVPLRASTGPVHPGPPGSLLLRGWYAGLDGHRLTGAPAKALISAYQRSPGRDWPAWLSRHHDRFLVSYQPAGRYWIFQGVQAGALLLLALLLAAATVWLVRSRGARIRGRRPGPG